MTQSNAAWLDRMYNNRGLVPEFDAHFARWQADSVAARQALKGQLDLPYGPAASETLDIFAAQPPSQGSGAPVMVFIHGGYWRSLNKSDQSFIAPVFSKAGACVVIPNYALCPGSPTHPVTVPDIALQIVKALAWVFRHIDQYGGDPTRITVAGHSAGGHLAAMMMAANWQAYQQDLPAALVKNGLSLSGLFELETIRQTPYLQSSLKLTHAQAKRCSPAWMPPPAVSGGRGTLFSVAGAMESSEFLRHTALIQSAWGRTAVPVSEALPDLNHFSILESMVQPGTRLNRLALQLLGL